MKSVSAPTDKVGASKVTKGMALTVAGKARLFMGDYENAKKDLKQVISSNKYELVPPIVGPICSTLRATFARR